MFAVTSSKKDESNLPIVTARYVIKIYQIFIYVCKKPIEG
jgi:hypothetical protein